VSTVDDKFEDANTDEFQPSVAADHDDDNPSVLARLIRKLQRDSRDYSERILMAIERFSKRLDITEDRVTEVERRESARDAMVDSLDKRVAALEARRRK
jgi:hypothetical protein